MAAGSQAMEHAMRLSGSESHDQRCRRPLPGQPFCTRLSRRQAASPPCPGQDQEGAKGSDFFYADACATQAGCGERLVPRPGRPRDGESFGDRQRGSKVRGLFHSFTHLSKKHRNKDQILSNTSPSQYRTPSMNQSRHPFMQKYLTPPAPLLERMFPANRANAERCMRVYSARRQP